MWTNYLQNLIEIFVEMNEARKNDVFMQPRSANDKEYFAQDWFSDRVNTLGITAYEQGRNRYPDFIVGEPGHEGGYEIKSLSFKNGRPARRDLDFNSTIPSGYKEGRDQFLVFFLYTGSGGNPRQVHTITLAHGDFINSDRAVADEHLNVGINDFGSYNDGYIRNRKMYVFPHPVALDETNLAKCRLIAPAEWNIEDTRLKKIKTITREASEKSIDSYTIKLKGMGQAAVNKCPNPDAGKNLHFDVFEVA